MSDKSYAAFISYKHTKSGEFAERLELALKAYAKPLWRPPMRIFRDEKILASTSDLWGDLRTALADSSHLVYLASPDAAEAPWVQKELAQWLCQDPALEHLTIVLTSGDVVYDPVTNQLDRDATNALPAVLKDRLEHVPLFVDARAFTHPELLTLENAEFKRVVNQVKAAILGIEPMAMSGDEVRQHRSNLRQRNGLIAAAGLAVLAAAGAFWDRQIQQQISTSNQLMATARAH